MADRQALIVVMAKPLSVAWLMGMVNEAIAVCDREVFADRTARGVASTSRDRLRQKLPGSELATAEIRHGCVEVDFRSDDKPGAILMIPDYKDKVGDARIDDRPTKYVVHFGMGWNDRATQILDALAVELQDFGECWRKDVDDKLVLVPAKPARAVTRDEESPSP